MEKTNVLIGLNYRSEWSVSRVSNKLCIKASQMFDSERIEYDMLQLPLDSVIYVGWSRFHHRILVHCQLQDKVFVYTFQCKECKLANEFVDKVEKILSDYEKHKKR